MNSRAGRFVLRHWGLLLFLLLHAAVHRRWLFGNGVLSAGDAGVYPDATLRGLLEKSLTVYDAGVGLGSASVLGGYKVIEALHGALAMLGLGYEYTLRILFLWPFVLLAPVPLYLLCKRAGVSQLAALVALVIYFFGSYVLVLQLGHLLILLAYAWVPLVGLASYRYFSGRETSLSSVALLTLSFLPLVVYDVRIAYIVLCVVLAGWMVWVAYQRFSSRVLLHFSVFVSLIAALNAFWIAPLLFLAQSKGSEVLARSLFGNHFFSLRGALALVHPFWTGGAPSIFQVQPIQIQEISVALLALLAPILSRRTPLVLICTCLAVIGILLGKQVAPPFAATYPFLFEHFPGFSAFREGSKFFVLIALGYAGLAALTVEAIERRAFSLAGRISFFAIVVLVLGSQLWHGIPLASGTFGGLFVERRFPDAYGRFNNFVANSEGSYRTLWIPAASRWADFTSYHPRIDAADAVVREWRQAFSSAEWSARSAPERLNELLLNRIDTLNGLIHASAVKYVVVPLVDEANDDDFFKYYGHRQIFVDVLSRDPELAMIQNEGGLTVFEVRNSTPMLYAVSASNSSEGTMPRSVEFSSRGEARYEVKNLGAQDNKLLVLAHAFDPNWKLCPGRPMFIFSGSANCTPSRPYERGGAVLNKFILEGAPGMSGADLHSVLFAGQFQYLLGILVSAAGLIVAFGIAAVGRHSLPHEDESRTRVASMP